MSFGVQVNDSSGALVWDSSTVLGGIVVDYREYAASAAGETVSYPQWPGYSALLLGSFQTDAAASISVSTSAGYPVVTVTSTSTYKNYALAVY